MSAMRDCIDVVLDTGSAYTKAGFANEAFPRCVFPTAVARFREAGLIDGVPDIYCGHEAIRNRGLSILTWPVQEGLIKDWEEMEKFWHHTFYKELYVPPEEARIMHAVHPLVPRIDKEKMAEILFESFTVRGLYLAKAPALVLHASGRTSGVVWESGSGCSYVAPVFEGFHLKHSTVVFPLTGDALTKIFSEMLKDLGYSFTTPFETDLLNRIKAETCYVAKDYEQELVTSSESGEKKRFELPDGQHVLLGTERFQCPEVLFRPSVVTLSCPSIVDSICSSINTCDLDYRPLFFNNVVVSGGSSMFPGLVNRLNIELATRVKTMPGFKAFVDEMSSRKFAVWVGGSILASLTSQEGFWVTRQEYEDVGPDIVNHKFL